TSNIIKNEKNLIASCIVRIAIYSSFTSIYVSKFLMNIEIGFGRKLLQILEEEHISYEHTPSGIDDITIVIRNDQLENGKLDSVVERIDTELQPDDIVVDRNLALVMVVGEGMKETIGITQKASTALGEAKVNIEMINQGSSEVSLLFGIKSNDLHRAIKSLYRAFFD